MINKSKKYLKNLEKNHLVSRKPHPIIPFLLTIITYALYQYSKSISSALSPFILALTILTLLFAIIHFIIHKILKL